MTKEMEEAIECLDDKETLKYIDKIANSVNPSEALESSVVLKFVVDLLKRYEGKTDYNIYITREWLLEIKQALTTKSKKELAWDIVKKKRIDLESFYTSFIEGDYDYSFYERHYGTYGKYELTEEEFELLKEVV